MARVLVAMSGGVDSTVAAALLVEQGHEVVGVTMKLWGGDSTCCSVADTDDARRVAHQLDIEHHVFNFGDEFKSTVYEPYIESYKNLEMPNPCIECNRHIKFEKLFRRADALDFDKVATGHHARVVNESATVKRIARGVDDAKDQSYVIHMLNQTQLQRLLLPVGSLSKAEVRAIAKNRGLLTADKAESQNVCFIPASDAGGTADRHNFLSQHIDLSPGALIDSDSGEQVGQTQSVELLSIGQRKGLGLGGHSKRRHVLDRNSLNGEVLVGSFEDLLVESQPLNNLVWSSEPIATELTIQSSAHGARHAGSVTVDPGGKSGANSGTVQWSEPRMKIAKGQSVVFYDADNVVGGAFAG